jgi:hypothetical protein
MRTDENIQKLWLACQIACLLKFINKFDEDKVAKFSETEAQLFSQCTTQLQLLAASLHPDLFQANDDHNSDKIAQIAILTSSSREHLSSITSRRSSLAPTSLRHKNLVENYIKHVTKNYSSINETIDRAYELAWNDYTTEKYYGNNKQQEETFAKISSPSYNEGNSTIVQILLHKLSNPTNSMLESITSLKLNIYSTYGQNYSRIGRLFTHFQHHFMSILPDTFDSLMQNFKSLQVDTSLRSLQLLEQHKKNKSVSGLLLAPAEQWQRSLQEAAAKRPKINTNQTTTTTSRTLKKNNARNSHSTKPRRESDLLDYQPRPLAFLKPLANLVKQETVRLNSCWFLFSCFTGKRAKARNIESAYNDVFTAARNNKVNSLKEALHLNNSSLIKAFAHRRNIDKKAPSSWNNLMRMFNSSHHSHLKFDNKIKLILRRFK